MPAQPRATGGPIHLLVDSSGLKLGGPGEWQVEKHGTSKRRSWRKLHIGFDAVSGRIVASILTDRDVDDASQVEPLLDQIAEPVELFLGDGGYDRTNVYTALDERHPAATVVVPPVPFTGQAVGGTVAPLTDWAGPPGATLCPLCPEHLGGTRAPAAGCG